MKSNKSKIPSHKTEKLEWFDEAPTEIGLYWFYGAEMGGMGGHYDGTVKPEAKLKLISIRKISNGILAVTDGHFFELNKWDGKKAGWLGRWAQCTVPDVSNQSIVNIVD